jgi:hypothetical protein
LFRKRKVVVYGKFHHQSGGFIDGEIYRILPLYIGETKKQPHFTQLLAKNIKHELTENLTGRATSQG